MNLKQGGYRDLLSEFDCLRFEARRGRINSKQFLECVMALLGRAEGSLDPRVHRFLVPALLGSIPSDQDTRFFSAHQCPPEEASRNHDQEIAGQPQGESQLG